MGKLTTPSDSPTGHAGLWTVTERVRQAVPPPTDQRLDDGLTAVRERLAAARVRRRAGRQVALCAAAAIGVAAMLWQLPALRQRLSSPAAVAVDRIDGGALLDGGYLSQVGADGVRLLFNEGSAFQLTPGSRGRLREVLRDGARFSVEEGAASVQITPNPARHWSVEAGPFLVTVKGTAFNLSWDPTSERFELVLRRGHVVVDGPVTGGGIPLRAGQRLVVVLPRAEILISEDKPDRPAPSPAPEPRAAPVAADTAAPKLAIAATAHARRQRGERPWAELLAAGAWDRILADAERDGLDATLKVASSDELLALADAARYRRRVELARAALLAHRRRFPGSPRALDALFLLGRVEELTAGGAPRAMAIYDEYLARAPAGGYAAEALGRKMILMNDLGGAAKARPVAGAYLLRFPHGSYAAAARALSEPSPE